MSGVPPKKGEALSFTIPGLISQADTDIFQVNPTLAAGDVKVFKDGVASGNINTLPTAIDAGEELWVVLAAAEMNAASILVKFKDVAGDEWQSQGIVIFTDTMQIGGVWSYGTRTLTQTAAEVAAALAGSDITIIRGDTLTVTLTGLGDISDRDKLWFTMKHDPDNTDDESAVQIEETLGLSRLNGEAGTAGDGSIVVDDEVAGDVTITLKPAASAELVPGVNYYDVQVLMTTGSTVSTLTAAEATVAADTTHAIS